MISVREVFRWWIEELARVVEPLALRGGARAAFVLVQTGERYTCLRAGRKGMTELGQVEADALGGSDVLKKWKNQQVEVRLDPDLVLDKHLKLPAAGQQYIEAILRHQIERLTPWTAEHVAFDYVVDDDKTAAAEGQVAIRLVATARETVDGILGPLGDLGIKPTKVGTAGDPIDQPSQIDLQDSGKLERVSSLRRAVAVTLGATAALLIVIGGVQSWRVYAAEKESSEIQQAIDARRALITEAVARTTASDEYRALAARKASALPMVVLLEELSKTIPENTYLTELNVEGNTVRINGSSSAATELIALLEDADALVDAQFGAPTTRSENGRSDSFQIVLRIDAQEGSGQ